MSFPGQKAFVDTFVDVYGYLLVGLACVTNPVTVLVKTVLRMFEWVNVVSDIWQICIAPKVKILPVWRAN